MVAKRIIEEIQLTAWNLSQNFLYCKNQQARMYLTGIGDPMRGLGGVNYIKYPQKLSKYETFLQNKNKRNRSEEIVTGTNSDLRKLPMKEVHAKLKRHGYTEENLSKLERWDKIEILRDLANKQSQSLLYDDDLKKYSRNLRMTTDKQKEQYQKDINELFMRTIDTLSRKGAPPKVPKINEENIYGNGFEAVKESILKSIEELKGKLSTVKKEKHKLIYNSIDKQKQDIVELKKCEEFLNYCQFLPSQEAFFHPDVINDVWWQFKEMLQELQDYKSFDLDEQREQANPKTRKKKEKSIVLKHWIKND
jgi:transcription initiation factor TFIID subunit 1